jgi:hypothetical protein
MPPSQFVKFVRLIGTAMFYVTDRLNAFFKSVSYRLKYYKMSQIEMLYAAVEDLRRMGVPAEIMTESEYLKMMSEPNIPGLLPAPTPPDEMPN